MTRALDEEYTILTPAELAILVALAKMPTSGYGLIEQIKVDTHDRIRLSHGTIYAALKRMLASGYIGVADGINGKRPHKVYRLTRGGQMVLGWEISAARRMINLADKRL